MTIETSIKGNKIFAPLKKTWVQLTTEERLKQEFIARLINYYGYSLDQLGQDIEIKNKVRVDIAIWKNAEEKSKNKIPSIIIAIECKAEHVSIKKEDIFLSYKIANSVKANFFIATNLKETKVYHIQEEVVARRLEKLRDIPYASQIVTEKSISNFIQETKIFTRDEFSKLLSKCHNIIRNNDKLSPEAAFDEISKILFMKIMYERESKEEIIFSLDKFRAQEKDYEKRIRPSLKSADRKLDVDYMQWLFEETKRSYESDEIFDHNDKIRIRKNSFEQIVKELESFNLSDTSDDVKGIAFEEFLGKTFRGELGQFFTPRTIVDYMVEILDPKEGERVCDPCCGSGGFLIKSFEYVKEKIEKDVQQAKEKIEQTYFNGTTKNGNLKKDDIFNQLNGELSLQNKKSRLRTLSYDCIFGTDANPRMARTAKMNMIMHGDGHGGVHHHDGLLNVNGIFDGSFDVILTNPPFGARVEKSLKVTSLDVPSEEKVKKYKKRYPNYENDVVRPLKEWAEYDNGPNKSKGKAILDLFKVGKMSGLTEVLFIERCINLLKPGGRMGIVLPEGVLNNTALQKVRDCIEGQAKIVNITSIPQDVFIASGATVKPSLVFLRKFTDLERIEYDELARSVSYEVDLKHSSEQGNGFQNSKGKLTSKSNKGTDKKIEQQKEEEYRMLIKERFNYPVSVVEVEKAGISSTGAPCENELEPVAQEFRAYANQNGLWNNEVVKFLYSVNNKGQVERSKMFHNVMGTPEIF